MWKFSLFCFIYIYSRVFGCREFSTFLVLPFFVFRRWLPALLAFFIAVFQMFLTLKKKKKYEKGWGRNHIILGHSIFFKNLFYFFLIFFPVFFLINSKFCALWLNENRFWLKHGKKRQKKKKKTWWPDCWENYFVLFFRIISSLFCVLCVLRLGLPY